MLRSPPGTRLWWSATTARAATGKVGVTNNPDHTVQGGIYHIIVQGGRCTSWALLAPPAQLATPAMTACVPACDHSQETIVNTIKEKYNQAIKQSSPSTSIISLSLGGP